MAIVLKTNILVPPFICLIKCSFELISITTTHTHTHTHTEIGRCVKLSKQCITSNYCRKSGRVQATKNTSNSNHIYRRCVWSPESLSSHITFQVSMQANKCGYLMILYEYEHRQHTMCRSPLPGPRSVIQMNKGAIVYYLKHQTDI